MDGLLPPPLETSRIPVQERTKMLLQFNSEFAVQHNLKPLEAFQNLKKHVDRIKHFLQQMVRSFELVRVSAREYSRVRRNDNSLALALKEELLARNACIESMLAFWNKEEKQLRCRYQNKFTLRPWTREYNGEMARFTDLFVEPEEKRKAIEALYYRRKKAFNQRECEYQAKVRSLKRTLSKLTGGSGARFIDEVIKNGDAAAEQEKLKTMEVRVGPAHAALHLLRRLCGKIPPPPSLPPSTSLKPAHPGAGRRTQSSPALLPPTSYSPPASPKAPSHSPKVNDGNKGQTPQGPSVESVTATLRALLKKPPRFVFSLNTVPLETLITQWRKMQPSFRAKYGLSPPGSPKHSIQLPREPFPDEPLEEPSLEDDPFDEDIPLEAPEPKHEGISIPLLDGEGLETQAQEEALGDGSDRPESPDGWVRTARTSLPPLLEHLMQLPVFAAEAKERLDDGPRKLSAATMPSLDSDPLRRMQYMGRSAASPKVRTRFRSLPTQPPSSPSSRPESRPLTSKSSLSSLKRPRTGPGSLPSTPWTSSASPPPPLSLLPPCHQFPHSQQRSSTSIPLLHRRRQLSLAVDVVTVSSGRKSSGQSDTRLESVDTPLSFLANRRKAQLPLFQGLPLQSLRRLVTTPSRSSSSTSLMTMTPEDPFSPTTNASSVGGGWSAPSTPQPNYKTQHPTRSPLPTSPALRPAPSFFPPSSSCVSAQRINVGRESTSSVPAIPHPATSPCSPLLKPRIVKRPPC